MPLNNLLPHDVAVRWHDKSPENLRLRALETGCAVISADVTGTRGDWTSYGCSRVVGAQGELLGAVPELQEGWVSVALEF